jgi:hypothetical protein
MFTAAAVQVNAVPPSSVTSSRFYKENKEPWDDCQKCGFGGRSDGMRAWNCKPDLEGTPCATSGRSPDLAQKFLPIRKDGAATQRFRRGSGSPEKVFNEFWKPSRGRLGARRGRKVLDDHKAVDFSL